MTFVFKARIERPRYFFIGFALLLLKQYLDRAVAAHYGLPWDFLSYWIPIPRMVNLFSLNRNEASFLLTMAMVSVPFIFLGTVLTLARLRSMGLSLWMVVLFFVPLLNLFFFLFLLSWTRRERPLEHHLPAHGGPRAPGSIASALIAVLITTVLAVLVTALSSRALNLYGVGLFLALPFCLGMTSSLVYGLREPRLLKECLLVGLIAAFFPAVALLVFAMEGLGCLVMVLPLALPLVLLGSLIGWAVQDRPSRRMEFSLLVVPLLFSPVFSLAEHWMQQSPGLLQVRSTIEIAASPESVFKEVVAFSEIPEPTELLFKTGIAYPIRARMEGRGPGAVRRCEFTTGPFIEPIEVWDEPRLLRFTVARNPPPMNEWSPYGAIDTPHLHGTLTSKRGQFQLVPLPNGHTRLEGTTWYTQNLQPAIYWSRWSDYIIHRIHMRVLEHIKSVVEGQA